MPNYDNIYGFKQISSEEFKAFVAELTINIKEKMEQEILQKAGDSNILIFKQSETYFFWLVPAQKYPSFQVYLGQNALEDPTLFLLLFEEKILTPHTRISIYVG